MKRSLTLLLLLATMLVLASCASGDDGRADRSVPSESRTQEATAPESATEETTRNEILPEEAAPEDTASEEAATVDEAPADNGAAEDEPGTGSDQEGPSGLVVTTTGGEEVSIGQGEVTALFFMAGW